MTHSPCTAGGSLRGGSSPRASELPAGPFRPQLILTEGGRTRFRSRWKAWGKGPLQSPPLLTPRLTSLIEDISTRVP